MNIKNRFLLLTTIVALLTTLVPVMAATEASPDTYPLYAGQDILVGEVQVWNDADYLYVKYVVEDPWMLAETHLIVATSLEGIPQTLPNLRGRGGGNPIPGQFTYKMEHDPWVAEYTYMVPLDWESDDLVIAAHAVVMDTTCYQTGLLYGIQRFTGDVYGVDVLSGTSWLEFTIPNPPGANSASPNGLAYDEDTGYFYYTDYQLGTTPDTLYFWDGFSQQVAGTVTGTVACADMYEGKYYYIPSTTDDLWEVTFNPDGTISGNIKVDDIADNAHGWTFDGDIAVKEGIVYGWGRCKVSGHGFEFFTYDLTTGAFSFTKTAYQYSLQLAFGSNGELYGHRSGTGGYFYVVDTTDGAVTLVTPTPVPPLQYTDTASGMICEPYDETAWAAGCDFPGANWATYFTYTISCAPRPIDDGSLSITGTGWAANYAWLTPAGYDFAENRHSYDLTCYGEPIALQGYVDTSEAELANPGDWSKYFLKISVRDSDNKIVNVVFANSWLGNWYEIPAHPWDRISLETENVPGFGSNSPHAEQWYATQGGTLGYDMDGKWVGAGNGATVYPSDQNYYFQLIADPSANTFTLQVYGMGSSAMANPPDAWPKQNMYDYATWLEIGSITVGAGDFNFEEVEFYAALWSSTQAGAEDTSTISWSDMSIGPPVPFTDIP